LDGGTYLECDTILGKNKLGKIACGVVSTMVDEHNTPPKPPRGSDLGLRATPRMSQGSTPKIDLGEDDQM
jgi:hypothetical protein